MSRGGRLSTQGPRVSGYCAISWRSAFRCLTNSTPTRGPLRGCRRLPVKTDPRLPRRLLAAAPPARSTLFLCTTGEEQGLVGARAFVAQRDRLPGPLVAALNIDGTSIQPFRTLDARGGSQSSLGTLAEEAGRRAGIGVRHESLGVGGSDHAPFLLAGIPPIWIGAALPDDWMRTRYHTPQDDMAQPIDFGAVAAYTQFVSTLARLIANAPTRPAWREGEFFGCLR